MPCLFFVELNPLLKMSSKNGSGDSFIIIYGKSIRKKEWTLFFIIFYVKFVRNRREIIFSRLSSPSKRMTTEIFGCRPNFASPCMWLPQEFGCCWVKYVSCDSHSLSQAYLHHTCGGHILRHNPRRRQAGVGAEPNSLYVSSSELLRWSFFCPMIVWRNFSGVRARTAPET